ncbi:alanine racemase [Ruania alba]|uniref:D-serine deaminase, pyridoxal phosphate-dependent n=1 Tax=Ruania alba TaxID=648782 RepID=A0A1H5B9E5_9MICO|nr:alanine racemase [Ruania alba]SED50550.1 D-serine deaminase, pyridoxal phosphate-dependent [Ruania alba]
MSRIGRVGATDAGGRPRSGVGRAPRPAPWRDATRSLSAPIAVVDLDAFDANAADLLARAGGVPLRVASKSVRVRHLVRRALDRGFASVMAYSLAEALWLAEDGVRDILVGYPSVDTAALVRLAQDPVAREAITVMVDDVSQVALLERAFMRAEGGESAAVSGAPINVCLDVDASLRLGLGPLSAHLGVRRSPLRTPEDVVRLARATERTGRLRVRGVMFYEAQVAGVPDGSGWRNPGVQVMKGLSLRDLARRRPAVVAALEDHLGRDVLVNGGGTGSLQQTATDPTVTELTAGSGLLCPTLFDSYDAFDSRPAAFFGLDVVRRPAARIATAFGGGYVASGPAHASRLPRPVDGARLLGSEGAGEVQTPLRYRPRRSVPAVGARVWLRHAKAGELMERFDQVRLVRGAAVVDAVPTYRGEGQNFG